MTGSIAARPEHVDPARVVDFDFWRPGSPGSDPFMAWTALHGKPPLMWTPRNGGHCVVTRGEDVPKILADHERFSARRAFIDMESVSGIAHALTQLGLRWG